jgi:hypothetical protein
VARGAAFERLSWSQIAIEGDISRKDCALRFKREGRSLAIASISRDQENLQGELVMERESEALAQAAI